jgi:hypothetical protein
MAQESHKIAFRNVAEWVSFGYPWALQQGMHMAHCYFDFYLVNNMSFKQVQGVRLPRESLSHPSKDAPAVAAIIPFYRFQLASLLGKVLSLNT